MAQNNLFKKMYERLGWSDKALTKLVHTEGINTLELLGTLTVEHAKSVGKDIRRPGGDTSTQTHTDRKSV